MKKTLIQIASFAAGFALIGILIYVTSIPSLERLQNRILTPLVTLTVQAEDCFDLECAEVFTIEANGETSYGETIDQGSVDTLLGLLTTENSENVEYLGFTNPYCSSKGWISQQVELTLTINQEEKSFPLCQIVNVEQNELFSYVVSLLP